NVPPRFNLAEKSLGERIVAAHAVKQARGRQLRAHPRADVRDQDRKNQQLKQKKATYLPSHQGERRFHLFGGKRLGAPHELGRIYFQRRQNSCQHAHQHGGQQDIPSGILYFLRECRDAVEADVGQYSDGSTVKNRIQIERRRIIKRPRKKTGSIFVQTEEEADNKSKK